MRRDRRLASLVVMGGYLAGAGAWALAASCVIGSVGIPWQAAMIWPRVALGRVIQGDYGLHFALITTHLWGSVGAVLAYLARGRAGWAFQLRGLLVAIGVLALMFGSVRWLVAESDPVGGRAWVHDRQFFRSPVGLFPVALPPAAFLLWFASSQRTSGPHSRRRAAPCPRD